MIYEIEGIKPVISPKAFVHETAVIIGDVIIEEGVYVGPNASIRGDFGRIVIKKDSNIQDSCILHGYTGVDTIVEENGHIGHAAVLHTCHIKKNALIGMGAVIMDEAVVGENSIIGALSLVPAKMDIPDNHLALGVPAKVKRELREEEIQWKKQSTQSYIELTSRCLKDFKACEALKELTSLRENQKFEMNYKPKNS